MSVLALAVASPAQGSFLATATDPAGDVAVPGRDLTDASLAYDRESGSLQGAVRFAGAPAERSVVTLFMGVRTPTGCNGYPAIGFGTFSDESGASWLRLNSAGATPTARGDADKVGGGSRTQVFEAKDPAFVGGPWNCALAAVSEPGNAAVLYDTIGPMELVGQPELSIKVRGVPKEFKPDRRRRLRITVANGGDGPAKGVKLRLARAPGLRLERRSASLPTIAAGRRKTITVGVALSGRAETFTELLVKASAGKLVARETVRLRLERPDRGGGGGSGGGSRTCTRFSPDPFGDTGGSLILVPC